MGTIPGELQVPETREDAQASDCCELLVGNIVWQKDSKPKSEDIWCVIWVRDDYEFAYWVEGTGCWDCPSAGWIEDKEVEGWFALPEPPAH